MYEVNRYLGRLTKWTLLALAMVVALSMVANAQTDDYGMDSDARNPGRDKQCLKYEDCPNWDGNADTKVYYDLMKLSNGTGVIAKSDFNWNVHLYTCHLNELLDSINGEGAFERLAIISAKNGMIPCPIGVNPHWSYDWELHILKARIKNITKIWPNVDKNLRPGPQNQSKQQILN